MIAQLDRIVLGPAGVDLLGSGLLKMADRDGRSGLAPTLTHGLPKPIGSYTSAYRLLYLSLSAPIPKPIGSYT
jgi:hypothetical protein